MHQSLRMSKKLGIGIGLIVSTLVILGFIFAFNTPAYASEDAPPDHSQFPQLPGRRGSFLPLPPQNRT